MDMASRRIDVFFYGLFMDVALLQQQGIQPANVRRARVEGFDVVIAERATLVPRAARTVFGVLISLTHEDVTHLYADASVQDYRPKPSWPSQRMARVFRPCATISRRHRPVLWPIVPTRQRYSPSRGAWAFQTPIRHAFGT